MQVNVRDNNVEQALRALKKKLQREGVFREMKLKQHFEKPSVKKAREQAEEYGHSFEREMGFLAVHGFLHINGYDHYTPEEEKEMFGLQEEILTAYGLTRQ